MQQILGKQCTLDILGLREFPFQLKTAGNHHGGDDLKISFKL